MSVVARVVPLVSVGFVLTGAALAQDTETLSGRTALPPVPDWLAQALHGTGRAIEVVGIGIIVLGALAASLHFLWQLLHSGAALAETYHPGFPGWIGRRLPFGPDFGSCVRRLAASGRPDRGDATGENGNLRFG